MACCGVASGVSLFCARADVSKVCLISCQKKISRINQPVENAPAVEIDNEIGRDDVSGIWHGDPISTETCREVVGLHLQPPAEMVCRPGKLDLVADDLHHQIGG